MQHPFPPDFTIPNLGVARQDKRVTITIFGWSAILDCRDDTGTRGYTYFCAPGAEMMVPAHNDVYDGMSLLTDMHRRDAELAGIELAPCALRLSPQAAVRLIFTSAFAQDKLHNSQAGELPGGAPVLYMPVGKGAQVAGIHEILVSPSFLSMSLVDTH